MPLSPADFKKALGQFASGVTVVTTRDAAGNPLGLTVASFCSVSIEPPLVLVCVDRRSEAVRGFAESGMFAVNVLAEGQEDVSQRFAYGGPQRFDGLGPSGEHGLVLIPGARARLECRLHATHDAGDHLIYVGEVLRAEVEPGAPLVYHAGRYRRLHEEQGVSAARPASTGERA